MGSITYKIKLAFRIVLIGNSTVGKSTFINFYARGTYDQATVPTIGVEFIVKHLVYKDVKNDCDINYKIHFWDTAGQERFRAITKSYYRQANMIFLMFDLTNRASFDSISYWVDDIQKSVGENSIGIMIVGTKLDLEANRIVDHNDVQSFISYQKSRGVNIVDYIEISTQNSVNLDTLLDKASNHLIEMAIAETKNKKSMNKEFEIVTLDEKHSMSTSKCC